MAARDVRGRSHRPSPPPLRGQGSEVSLSAGSGVGGLGRARSSPRVALTHSELRDIGLNRGPRALLKSEPEPGPAVSPLAGPAPPPGFGPGWRRCNFNLRERSSCPALSNGSGDWSGERGRGGACCYNPPADWPGLLLPLGLGLDFSALISLTLSGLEMGAVLGTLIWLHEEEEEEEERLQQREEEEEEEKPPAPAAQRPGAGPVRRPLGREAARRRLYPANRVYRPRVTFLELSEEECRRRLRFSRQAVTDLCSLLQQDLLPAGPGGHALPVAVKVTTALNFFASGSFQGAAGDISHISQSAVHKCIKQVTNALFARANDYISFPMDAGSQNERAVGFAAVAGFPRVQGVIDCTHVAIKAPDNQPAAFNRKGYYSINVQLVSDHHHRIMQVCARFPGSCSDAFILHESTIPPLFHSCQNVKGWLVGDKDYPLHTWLMTPLLNPSTPAEMRYNESHGTTRRVIKHTIGLLKQRFHCLDRSGGPLQYSPQRVSRIVVVCCILHNLAVQRGLHLEQEEYEDLPSSDEEDFDESEEETEEGGHQLAARDVRNQFIAQHFA